MIETVLGYEEADTLALYSCLSIDPPEGIIPVFHKEERDFIYHIVLKNL